MAGRTSRWLVAGVAVALTACGTTGSATTRVDAAEAEIERITADIVDTTGLEVATERPLGARGRCELPGGRAGATNALSVRGPVPDDDPVGRAGAVLVDAGYELVDADIGDGVFGRRDGIRITVVVDRPTGQLAVDANTGCRMLPG